MHIMTSVGPIPTDTMLDAIRQDVEDADSGIKLESIPGTDGMVVLFSRQGRTLPWRLALSFSGKCGLYKPPTASLPRVHINFPENQHLKVRDTLLEYINKGWI